MSSHIELFFGTLFVIMLAEFGDKTHLIVISLMTKTQKPYPVALGGFLGITLVTLIGVIIGSVIGANLPLFWITLGAGVVFLALGVWTLRGENDEEESLGQELNENTSQLVLRSSLLVGMAELGDKSQIFVVTASAASSAIPILLGSSLGMGLIFLVTALVGEQVLQYLDHEKMEVIAGLLFMVAGVWLILTTIL